MDAEFKVVHNTGIISIGDHAQNTVIQNHLTNPKEIDWKRLAGEVETLKTNPDACIKKFANEASEAIQNKDAGKIKDWLVKWVPCIGSLIATSYYILEIAARLGAL